MEIPSPKGSREAATGGGLSGAGMTWETLDSATTTGAGAGTGVVAAGATATGSGTLPGSETFAAATGAGTEEAAGCTLAKATALRGAGAKPTWRTPTTASTRAATAPSDTEWRRATANTVESPAHQGRLETMAASCLALSSDSNAAQNSAGGLSAFFNLRRSSTVIF